MAVVEIWPRDQLLGALDHPDLSSGVGELNAGRVPPDLRVPIGYAQVWGGILEEAARDELVGRAPIAAVDNLCSVVGAFEPLLTAWLAGPEAGAASPTLEYCAFTALVMAADHGRLRL